MHHLIVPSLIAAAALLLAVVGLLAFRAMIRTHQHVAQCSKIASELALTLARSKKLEVEVAELGELCERLQQSINKWRGRAAANAKREADDHDLKKLQGAAWKDQMRKQLKIGTPAIGGTSSEG